MINYRAYHIKHPLTKKLYARIHPIQLRSEHVTLLGAELQPPELSSQSDLRHRAASRWALPQISCSFYYCLLFCCLRDE